MYVAWGVSQDSAQLLDDLLKGSNIAHPMEMNICKVDELVRDIFALRRNHFTNILL